jgi:hypothetical protein
MTMDVDGFLDGPRKTLEVAARSLELAVERHAAEGKAAAEALERVRDAVRALGVAREGGEAKGARAKAGGAGRVVRAGEPVGNLDCPLAGCSFGGTTAEGLVSHLGSRHPSLRGQGKARKERRAELVILAEMNAAVAAPAEKVEAWPGDETEAVTVNPGVTHISAAPDALWDRAPASGLPPAEIHELIPDAAPAEAVHELAGTAEAGLETVEPDGPYDALLADAIHNLVAVGGPSEVAASGSRRAAAVESCDSPLRCPVEAGEDGPCRFDPDGDPDAVYRHLRRRHGDLYGGDDPDDIEWRADAVRKALANAGRDATWEAPA